MISTQTVTVHRQAFSELKMPYDTVVAADFADLECEASAKSVTVHSYLVPVTDFADASHSKSAKSATTTVSYGIFSSENACL